MNREESHDENHDHTTNSCVHFYLIHKSLHHRTVSENFENLKESNNSD